MFSWSTERGEVGVVRNAAHVAPVFFTDVLVDLDHPGVEWVIAIASRSGDPVFFPGFDVKVGCLVTRPIE